MCDSGTNEKKIRVYRVTRPDYGGKDWCIFRSWNEIEDELKYGEPEDQIIVAVLDLTEEELDNLPEFEGW